MSTTKATQQVLRLVLTCIAGITILVSSQHSQAGLVSYWNFDEASGITAFDSADSHDGTISGASRVAGKIGGGLSFDGANDFVEVPDHNDLDPSSQEMTLAAWVNLASLTPPSGDQFSTIIGKTASPTRDIGSYTFGIFNNLVADPAFVGKLSFGISFNGLNFQQIISNNAVPVNEFVHVAFTHDSSNISKFYINGILDSTDSTRITQDFLTTNTHNFRIGHSGSFNDFFFGGIDEVRFYDMALSGNEIAGLVPEPSGITLALSCLPLIFFRSRGR